MNNELSAKDAVDISESSPRIESLKQSVYNKIKRSARRGLYSTTIYLVEESRLDIETLIRELTNKGYSVSRFTDVGYYYKTELVKTEIKIEWMIKND